MSSSELQCPVCQRIYELPDVPDELCPFCEPQTKLRPIGGSNNIIADLFSLDLGWPAGQERVLLTVSRDYMDAQLTKAQLESNGIPVIIDGSGLGRVYSLTVGSLAEYKVFVPESLLAQAQRVLNNGN